MDENLRKSARVSLAKPFLMIYIRPGKCDYCGCCVGVCPEDAIELQESKIAIIEERCTNCRKCVWACPWEVIEFHREGIGGLPKEITALDSLQFAHSVK